jgi:hypothetical protein
MRIAQAERLSALTKKAAGFASDGLPVFDHAEAFYASDETRLVRRENLRDAVFL